MTPEEKAVIDQAIYLRYCIDAGTAGDPPRIGRLLDTVDALIFACPQCNAGGHTCPGDGNPIGHTATDCGGHDKPHSDGYGVATCGREDIHGPHRTKLDSGWHECMGTIQHKSHSDVTGRPFEVGDEPIVFPVPAEPGGSGVHDAHRSPASRQDAPDGSTYPCWECLTDPAEDPRPWCDCRPEDFGKTHPGHPCRLRAHSPENCLNRPEPAEPAPVWVPTTMGHCLINDRIRIGQEEATVLRSNKGIWNVDPRNYWQPAAYRHVELRMELDTVPGFQQYPESLAIEMLCTPERLAVLRIQEGFPSSSVISSDVH